MKERKLNRTELSHANTVIERACYLSGVAKEDLLSKSKATRVCIVRHAIAYAFKSATYFTYKNIVSILGRANHTTAMHSYMFVLEQMGASSRNDDMEKMVLLSKALKQYIAIEGHINDDINEVAKRNAISEMRNMGCNMMAVVDIALQLTYQIK